MCPVCAIKAVIKSAISKHRRAKIYRNMQAKESNADSFAFRQMPAINGNQVATGNHAILKGGEQ